MIFTKGKLVCRGKDLLTHDRQFDVRRRLVVDRVSMRHVHTRHEVGAAFTTGRTGLESGETISITARFMGDGRLALAQDFRPRPFMPRKGRLGRRYRSVFTVRMTKLTRQLIRAKTGATMMKVSNKLSSALTLLIYIGAFSGLKLSEGKVLKVAVPNFKAASHACRGTVGLVGSLKVSVHRVDVGSTYVRRFGSVSRSVGIRSIACRGSRTHRHARVLVSITGRA